MLLLQQPRGAKAVVISLITITMLTLSCSSATQQTPDYKGKELRSGERIPIGTQDQRGALSAGISSIPVGNAFVFESAEPDLFVEATHHSLYPGLYLYRWTGRSKEGIPVFGKRQEVHIPGGKNIPSGTIFQTPDKVIHGWWLKGSKISRTIFNRQTMSFEASPNGLIDILDIPDTARIDKLSVLQTGNGQVQIILGLNDGTGRKPLGAPNWRSPEYQPFDGAGIYRGILPFVYLYSSEPVALNTQSPVSFSQSSQTSREGLNSFSKITPVNFGTSARSIVTGSRFGNMLYYKFAADRHFDSAKLITDPAGIGQRHPSIGPSPMAYTNPETGWSDLITGGEGALYYYRFSGKFNKNGSPIFSTPTPVLEENALLYPGSLPVINVVDWDKNGELDIVAGNSEGRVLLFRNAGTNASPAFLEAEAVRAGGKPVFIQGGYRGSIQGPGEANWGYSCPTITNWNNDELPDIVMNSITGRQEVFLNTGKATAPEFDLPVPLYCRGLDMHGTWRVQPGAQQMGDRKAYVTLDDDDEFHIYWQIDAYNLEDGGKLRLNDGSAISANFIFAGGTGRSKIVLTDWDNDNLIDMIVGTPRHGSIPNPETGLPQSRGLKGAAVVFLKNMGTNEKPVFAFPTLMKFKEKPIYLGQHSCSPAIWDYGQEGGPDLLIGEQAGRIRFYARKDLSWDKDNTQEATP